MNRQELIERLEEIFADVFDEEIELSEEMTAADVEGWDSLTHITLLSAIEEEFNIKFSMKMVQSLKDVGDLVDAVEGLLQA